MRRRRALGTGALVLALLVGCAPAAPSDRPTATPGPTPSQPTPGFATLAWEPVELPIELAEARLVGVSGGPAGGVVFAWHGAEDERAVSALVTS